jgi:hypothetical protein
MVILNFIVPFALEAIPKGLKKRTMRPIRENPNSVWNRLYQKFQYGLLNWHPKIYLQLWYQQRSRYYICDNCNSRYFSTKDCKIHDKDPCLNYCQGHMQKEAHKLADAVLINMTKQTLGSLDEDEWIADGFEDMAEGFDWFMKTYKITREIAEILEVYIIEWELV